MSTPAPTDLSDLSDFSHLASPIALDARIMPDHSTRAHQAVISQAVMDAISGRGSRFICISVPQQFGKSRLVSFDLPILWQEYHALGIVPGGFVALVSYEDSLPMFFSNQVRRTIAANQDVLLTRLRSDSKAAGFWETQAGGGLIALGIGGAIVGRSISLFVIDDPFKNAEQASSERQRESVWDWWQSVAIGRLQPWTIVVVIHVRWREDDFIGRLKDPEYNGRHDQWRYIRIPYVCDDPRTDPCKRQLGEPLIRPQSKQTMEEARLEAEFIKDSISAWSWSTYWQQHPTDPEGTIFLEKNWSYWAGDSGNTLPGEREFDNVLMSWDMTFKDGRQNDWVVGQAWGRRGADFYLIDQVRGHWGLTETIARVRSFAERIRREYPRSNAILVEEKANGNAVIDSLKRRVSGLIPVNGETLPEIVGSKEARGWACQPLQMAGNLHLPAPSVYPWVKDYVKELGDFPNGAHDDCVDSTTQALLWMQRYTVRPVKIMSAAGIDLSSLSRLDPGSR